MDTVESIFSMLIAALSLNVTETVVLVTIADTGMRIAPEI